MSEAMTAVTAMVYIVCSLAFSTSAVVVLVIGARYQRKRVLITGMVAFTMVASGFTVKAAQVLIILQDSAMSAAANSMQFPALAFWAIGSIALAAWSSMIVWDSRMARIATA